MKVLNSTAEQFQISVSEDELMILNNALNEVCNGIDLIGFTSRIGADRERVAALLEEIGALLDTMGSSAAAV